MRWPKTTTKTLKNMRTETVTRTLYKFDELSERAQERVIERLAQYNVDYGWWESVYDDAERVGLKIDGFDLDRNRHATGKFTEDAVYCAHKIKEEHGEQCETYKTAESFLRERDEIVDTAPRDENGDFEDESELDELLDECEEQFLKDILEDYSILLQKEYEYLTGEEAVKEMIEANGYEFTEEGELA